MTSTTTNKFSPETRARAVRMVLRPEITRVFAENFEVCGVKKVWRRMVRERFDIARCAVERLMRS